MVAGVDVVAGIFVGGRAVRMGGRPKGLLVGPSGEALVDRWRRMFDALAVPCVLVGQHPAYADRSEPVVEDDPAVEGPLAGLLGLLAHVGARSASAEALVVACDMPHVSEGLLARLVAAPLDPEHPAVAARRDGHWEPLFAKVLASTALPTARATAASGRRSLVAVLDALGACELPLSPAEEEELADWDTPAEVGVYWPPHDVR